MKNTHMSFSSWSNLFHCPFVTPRPRPRLGWCRAVRRFTRLTSHAVNEGSRASESRFGADRVRLGCFFFWGRDRSALGFAFFQDRPVKHNLLLAAMITLQAADTIAVQIDDATVLLSWDASSRPSQKRMPVPDKRYSEALAHPLTGTMRT